MQYIKSIDKPKIVSLLLLLLFTVAILGYIFLYFNKDLDRYVEAKKRLNFQKTITRYVAQTKESLQKSIANEKNRATLGKQIDEKMLRDVVAHYIHSFYLKKLPSHTQDGLLIERYYVEGMVTTPADFYALVDFFAKNDYPVQLQYPIHFAREKNSVKIDFVLAVYRLAPRAAS